MIVYYVSSQKSEVFTERVVRLNLTVLSVAKLLNNEYQPDERSQTKLRAKSRQEQK